MLVKNVHPAYRLPTSKEKQKPRHPRTTKRNYQYITCLRLSIRSVRMLGKVVYFFTWLTNHKMFRQEDITGTHLLMAPI